MNTNCSSPQKRLESVFDLIEEKIDMPISLGELSGFCGLSRYQLIRLFTRLCGLTPMDYIRQRRLSISLPMLLRGDRVIDVALNCGFAYEQSYIRAFREVFGITPARYRRMRLPLPIVEAPRLSGFTVSARGMLGEPQRVFRPGFSLSGTVLKYNYAENMLHGAPFHQGVSSTHGADYQAACRVSAANRFTHEYIIAGRNKGELATWHWPDGHWAIFRYIGLHPLDGEGAQRIRLMSSLVIGNWFTSEGLFWDGAFIERVEMDLLADAYCEVEILCRIP